MAHQRTNVESEQGGGFGWFLAGVIIGAVGALLYAPGPGRQTREYLTQKAQEGRAAVSETGREMYDRSREVYQKGRQMVDDAAELFERGRRLVRE